MKKKIFALLLVLCMVFGMTNITAYAAAGDTPEEAISLGFRGQPVSVTIPNGGSEFGKYYTETAQMNGKYSIVVTGEDVENAFVVYGDETYFSSGDSIVVNVLFNPSATFQICYSNWDDETITETTLEVAIDDPIGTDLNPAILGADEDGYVEANVALEERSGGYFYKYVSPIAGKVAVSAMALDSNYELAGYEFMVIDEMDAPHSSAVSGDGYVEIIDVAVGTELLIVVNTYDEANKFASPAGRAYLTIEPYFPEGSQGNPIAHDNQETVEYEGTLEANSETYFLTYFLGTVMTVEADGEFTVVYGEDEYEAVDGVAEVKIAQGMPGGRPMPESFSIVNEGEALDYVISYAYAPGHETNPKEVEDGTYETVLEEGSDMFFYTWTAPADGEVTFGVTSEDGWQFAVDNVTAGTVGDWHYFNDEEVIDSETFEVKEGDTYIIRVAGYDPEVWWTTPAATINLVVDFTADEIVPPATGDATSFALWFAVLALGVVALAGSVVMKKREF